MFRKGLKGVSDLKSKFSKSEKTEDIQFVEEEKPNKAKGSEQAAAEVEAPSETRLKGVMSRVSAATSEHAENVANAFMGGAKATADTVGACASDIHKKAQSGFELIKNKDVIDKMAEFSSLAMKNKVFDQKVYSDFFDQAVEFSTCKVSDAFKKTFELDKDAEEIVQSLKQQSPPTPESIDEIFSESKKEATQRAIAAFSLSSVMAEFDNDMADRYSNLSEDYKDFSHKTNLHGHENFKTMQSLRDNAKLTGATLEDGYNKSIALDPYNADIEHVVPKKEYYDSLMIRAATDDAGMVSAMNNDENLVFTVDSVNRSKASSDFVEYLEANGTVDPSNQDNIILEINGETYEVNKEDCLEAYENATEAHENAKLDALKELGISVLSSSVRIAIQQVVGLFLMESSDIFIEEIRDVVKNGDLKNEILFKESLVDRSLSLKQKLSERLESRGVFARAKTLGLESMISGAVGMIPMALLSLMIELPGFVFTIIRECFFSVLRAARLLLSKAEDKYENIKALLYGTVAAVAGVSLSQMVATAIAGIPGINLFTMEVASVLSATIITLIILVTLYYFDNKKDSLKTQPKPELEMGEVPA